MMVLSPDGLVVDDFTLSILLVDLFTTPFVGAVPPNSAGRSTEERALGEPALCNAAPEKGQTGTPWC